MVSNTQQDIAIQGEETDDTQRLILQSLSVDNLRSLNEISGVTLEKDITILAGQNGGGKTSFIDALLMLLGNKAPSDETRMANDQSIYVTGEFASMDETESFLIRAESSTGKIQRFVRQRVHKQFGSVPEAMTLTELRQVLVAAEIPSPGGTSKPPFVDAANQWIKQRPPDELEDRWVALPSELASRLPQLTVFNSQDAEDKQDQVKRIVAQESRTLLATETYFPKLTSIAEEVQEDIQPVLTNIKNTIKRYSPEIEDVAIAATFDFARVAPQVQIELKKRGGRTVDLTEAGSGLVQRVGLAIYAATLESLRANESSGSILAYDEPDTHLDYHAQRELFGIIREQGELEHVQVIVATHSVNLIDTVPVRSLRHFRLEDGRTRVDTLPDYADEDGAGFISDLAAGLGIRNSLLLNERCFLIVEGPTEQRALPILFRKATGETFASSGITLIDTGGSGAVRRLVEALIEQMKRSVVVLVDQDARELPGKINTEWLAKMQLVEGEHAFFVGTKEFEDAFSDEAWLRVANEHFPLKDALEWQLGEVAEARNDDAGMGRGLEVLFSRRLRRAVAKPELGEALGKIVTDSEIPDVIRNALSAARNASTNGG